MQLGLVTQPVQKQGFDLGLQSIGLRKLSEVEIPDYFYNRMAFDNEVLNSIFNGDGLIKGQTLTLAATKGSGKTTLLMTAMQSLINANPRLRCGYVSNEEVVHQLAYTAKRINANDVMADNQSDIDMIARMMNDLDVIVIDSIAGLSKPDTRSSALIEEYACKTLVKAAKQTGCTTCFICHFTKAGSAAGSKNWFHAVDTCILISKLDPEEYGENCRLIEVDKNRFGAATEVVLRMTPNGFDLSNPVEKKIEQDTDSRAVQKKQDCQAIMKVIRDSGSQGATYLNLDTTGIDLNRIERLLKELKSKGKVTSQGTGKGSDRANHRYLLGTTTPSDFAD
jgi:predicted ATP-dependent serine protease